MRFSAGFTVLSLIATAASADFMPFSGPLASTQPAFEAAAGGSVPTENFESFATGATVGDMPNLQAYFAPEYADGNPAPLPIVFNNSPVTPSQWTINFLNDRPAWSSWVVRPDAGESIYAFGQVNSQGDFVRISAFDIAGLLVGFVDAQPLSHGFAGFVSTVPIARVVVTPLGNADGANGMDNVQVSVTPVPAPGVAAITGFAFLALRRRR